MPPPHLPYHYDDIDLGFGRPRQDWRTALKYAAPLVASAGAYAVGKAKDVIWPPDSPIGPSLTPESDASLFSTGKHVW